MLKKILLVIIVLLAGFCIVAALQPDTFRISRSTTINASPEAVFAHVNTLPAWESWSPWAKLDPNAKTTFSGPESGTGAAMSWDGNNDIGAGTMTITESVPNERVQYRLDFNRPMEGTSMSSFVLEPEGSQTRVTWSMEGTNTFLAKAIGLLMNCEKMVGEQFEKGLASLKMVAETEPQGSEP